MTPEPPDSPDDESDAESTQEPPRGTDSDGPAPPTGGATDAELATRATEDPSSVDLETVFEALDGRAGATALEAVASGAPGRLAAHTETLGDLLRGDDARARRATLVAVREAARSDPDGLRPLVEPLREGLRDPSPDEARLTGKTLGALLDRDSPELRETIDDLLADLRADPDGARSHAFVALGSAFPAEAADALEPILIASDPAVVRSGLQALASISEVDPEAAAEVAPEVGAYLDGHGATARFAAEVLANVAVADPTAVEDRVDDLADSLQASDAPTRREAAGIVCSLARATPDAVAPLVPTLIDRLTDPDRIVRRDACYALGVVRAADAREAIEALEADASPELSAVAERALARIDGETGDPPLPELDPDEVFQHRGDGPSDELTTEEREEIRERRLQERENR
ncbi:hypothetical protein BRC81_12205 [Halobacteriales archaeon QS_1_68_20]|nr:MAG: hypothetical protein BRC81_12205 [Halobacteriales archaeon QS_1_68_20]